MSNTPRMTEQELAECHRRMRISKSKTRVGGGVGGGAIERDSPRKRNSREPGMLDNPAPSPYPPYKSKLEFQYSQHLDLLVKAGEVKAWWYEPTSFKLSAGKRFRPDFLIQYPDGMERRLEYVEIKSRFNKNIRDGLTHLAWCAQLYPCFTWRIVRWTGGGWDGSYVEV